MKITILGEKVAMEGVRLIRKPVKVYTVRYPLEETEGDYSIEEKFYLPIDVLISKIVNKTFEGDELVDFVEINLNKPLEDGIQFEQL